jgi:aerobic C4-dicarboxylate transport protein
MDHTMVSDTHQTAARKPWYCQLYVWVLVAIVLGILVGWLAPETGEAMQPIGTTFVEAMKMLIGPIVFLTIVGGIASVADLKKVGVTGLKALGYFQIGTILAMLTGLVAINIFRLGDGVNADAASIETTGSAAELIEKGENQQWWEFLTHIIPGSVAAPFVEGDILQIIFMAVIFGIALNAVGQVGAPVLDGIQRLTAVIFKVLNYIMKAAPLGAFGAMAFAVGKYGVETLSSLGWLILLFYGTSLVFVVVVLGSVMAFLKLNLFTMLKHFKEELLLILGTSTAEPALPGLMRKLQHAGVKKETVGLVVPTGYSFNLDGAAIYLSLAAVYIAQATNTELTIGQQLGMLAVMLLTSKGAAGVAGGGFIALTATLSTLGTIPAAGIMLIFGIDKFMSECRALVNFCGNAVATLFIAWWDKSLDVDRARRVFAGEVLPPLDEETATAAQESADVSTVGRATPAVEDPLAEIESSTLAAVPTTTELHRVVDGSITDLETTKAGAFPRLRDDELATEAAR